MSISLNSISDGSGELTAQVINEALLLLSRFSRV